MTEPMDATPRTLQAAIIDMRSMRMQHDAHIAAIRQELSEARGDAERYRFERDALAAWQCATCGAQFRTGVLASMLEGVTQCSQCVMVEVLTARCGALVAERDAAVARAERMQRVVEAAVAYNDGIGSIVGEAERLAALFDAVDALRAMEADDV